MGKLGEIIGIIDITDMETTHTDGYKSCVSFQIDFTQADDEYIIGLCVGKEKVNLQGGSSRDWPANLFFDEMNNKTIPAGFKMAQSPMKAINDLAKQLQKTIPNLSDSEALDMAIETVKKHAK